MWLGLIFVSMAYGAPVEQMAESRLHLSPASNITELTNIICDLESWPRLPDAAICDKYYVCDARFGYLAAEYCPEGMAFNIGQQECHLKDRVDCTTRPIFHNLLPSLEHDHTDTHLPVEAQNGVKPDDSILAGGVPGTTPGQAAGVTTAGTTAENAVSTSANTFTFPTSIQLSFPQASTLTIPAGTVLYLPQGYTITAAGNVSGSGSHKHPSAADTTGPVSASGTAGTSSGGLFVPAGPDTLAHLTAEFTGGLVTAPDTTGISTGGASTHAGHAGASTPITSGTAGTSAGTAGTFAGNAVPSPDTAGTHTGHHDHPGVITSISAADAGTPGITTASDNGHHTGHPDSAGAITPITSGGMAGTSEAEGSLSSVLASTPTVSATGTGVLGDSGHHNQPGHHDVRDSTWAHGATSAHLSPPPSLPSSSSNQAPSITTSLTSQSPEATQHGSGSLASPCASTMTDASSSSNALGPLSQALLGLYLVQGFPSQRPTSSVVKDQDLKTVIQLLQTYNPGIATSRSQAPSWPIPSHRLSNPNHPAQTKTPDNSCSTLQQNRIPDRLQCDKYYVCSPQQELLPYVCPDGLVFDPFVAECHLPQSVDCSDRPKFQPSPGTGVCPRLNGVYKNPEDCQEFYVCTAGSSRTVKCARGLAFGVQSGSCVSPEIAGLPGCERDPDEKLCEGTMNLPLGMKKLQPASDDCRSFIECSKAGLHQRRQCPHGQVFNPKLGFCDFPSRVPSCENYYL